MARDFQAALAWHMDKHKTTIADLVRDTGVSRDVINKLRGRANASTDVEKAILIAAYYGKTVNDFIAMREADEISQTNALLGLLTPGVRRLMEAQIRGLISQDRSAE